MPSLNFELKYPPFPVRVKNGNGNTMIFDAIRKRWLVLTPEEWVRQHLVNYLVTVKKYPSSFIAIEKEIALNDLQKRFDVVVYNKELKPYILIECKAPYIELNLQVAEQALRYNLNLKSEFVMITNGIADFVINIKNQVVELPDF
ncbi:MAG: type I restriction enzyme HsdR N-terminal domain-containing protein [Bacteroidetes bacterium]|nr:type I restriction enzyme HsdR N-terminal domain-containing protein [Bacteroidota bacterium]